MSGKRKPAPLRSLADSSDEEGRPAESKGSETPTDYEDVGSPSSSSTASGPVYVRKPGFRLHAHSLESLSPKSSVGGVSNKGKKKKGLISLDSKGVIPSADNAQNIKPKLKKEPLPMKLRALPQSFWQQPNVAADVSPAALLPVLPPLFNKEPTEDVTEIRPVTPPEERQEKKSDEVEQDGPKRENGSGKGAEARVINVDNPELLFRLFDHVKASRRAVMVKRGRPKKQVPPNAQRTLPTDDPCMVNMMSETFLPLLPSMERQGQRLMVNSTTFNRPPARQTLAMVSLDDGDKTVSLPALNTEHNYAQLLSELVVKL